MNSEGFFGFVFVVCIDNFCFLLEGVYEALELRDGGKDYMGKGVQKVFIFLLTRRFPMNFVLMLVRVIATFLG